MRKLPDGTEFYTLDEAEGKEFDTYDIYLHEFVLIFFGLEPEKPIQSRIKYQKGLFLFLKELEKRGYKVQDPHFIPYSYGPYSFVLARVLDNLWWSGFIEAKGEYGKETEEFKLTEKGKNEAILLIKEKIKEKDLQDLITFRQSIDQYTVDGILHYVYNNFPEMKEKSKIRAKFKDIKWGRGKG